MSVLLWFLLFLTTWFLRPVPALAQAGAILIDSENPSQVIRVQVPFASEVLLKVQDLPTSSAAHPAIFLQNEKFTYVAESPDHKSLAFCVDAQDHDWTGLMHLADGRVRQLGLSFDSEAAHPNFSEDGRYLILEENQSLGRRGLEVFDLEKGTGCRLDGREARDKFLNFSDAWWSPEHDRIYFKVEYNNGYRKSLGRRPKPVAHRIGEAAPGCGKVRYYSVAEFLEKYPDQSNHSDLALQKTKEE